MFTPPNYAKRESDHSVRIIINKNNSQTRLLSFLFSIREENYIILHHITLPCYPLADIEFNSSQVLPSNHFPCDHGSKPQPYSFLRTSLCVLPHGSLCEQHTRGMCYFPCPFYIIMWLALGPSPSEFGLSLFSVVNFQFLPQLCSTKVFNNSTNKD